MNVYARFALISLGMLGCSSQTTPSPAAPVDAGRDAPEVIDSSADVAPPLVDAAAKDASTACNALKNSILVAAESNVATDPPTPAGGAIADGTYRATAWTTYTGSGADAGATGLTVKGVLEFAGAAYQIVTVTTTGNQPAGEQRQGGTFTTDGAQITLKPTCPATAPTLPFVSYDSDGMKVTLYTSATGGGGVSGTTYTKQ